jgi:4-hydroxy-tetrahydrodipicolinate reductase
LKIAINGKSGRMGKLISGCIAEQKNGDTVCNLTDQPDVIVDFSSPVATLSLLTFAVEHAIPLVIGTTGFLSAQQMKITQAAEKIPIVQSPNMSVGGNVCLKMIEKLSYCLTQAGIDFNVGISEIHHSEKKDAPSGTALRFGDAVQGGGYKGNIQYASLRLGEVPGDHEVFFTLRGERIVIKHHAESRLNFALGALSAVAWVIKEKTAGLYDMQDVLGLRGKFDG